MKANKKTLNEFYRLSGINPVNEDDKVNSNATTNVVKDIHPGDEYFLVVYFRATNSLKFLGWGDMNEMDDWIKINLGYPSTNSYKKRGNTILYRGQFFEDAEEAFKQYKLLNISLN
jgi:hypothetical protein